MTFKVLATALAVGSAQNTQFTQATGGLPADVAAALSGNTGSSSSSSLRGSGSSSGNPGSALGSSIGGQLFGGVGAAFGKAIGGAFFKEASGQHSGPISWNSDAPRWCEFLSQMHFRDDWRITCGSQAAWDCNWTRDCAMCLVNYDRGSSQCLMCDNGRQPQNGGCWSPPTRRCSNYNGHKQECENAGCHWWAVGGTSGQTCRDDSPTICWQMDRNDCRDSWRNCKWQGSQCVDNNTPADRCGKSDCKRCLGGAADSCCGCDNGCKFYQTPDFRTCMDPGMVGSSNQHV